MSRLSSLNKQFAGVNTILTGKTTNFLPRIPGSATIDYNSEHKGTLCVKDFYAGKKIFITGCTGFLAKVILEKLFRSCPNVDKIYIMVRKKRNTTPMARIEKEILSSQCFSKIIETMGLKEFK